MAAIAAVAGPAALGISAAGVLLVGSVAGIIGAEVEAFKGLVSYYEENGTIDGSTKTVLDAASVGFRNATVGVAIDIGVGAAFSKFKTWSKGLPSKPFKGGAEIDFDLTKLSRSQQKAIESADNIINDHLKSSDLSAALGDLQGNPIAKPNGGYWNHAQEVKDAYAGLVRVEKTLAGSLQNPNLPPDVRAFIQDKYDSIISYMTTIEEMFAPYGGIK